MTRTPSLYPERRYLRAVERAWVKLEGLINRLAAAAEPLRPYNPFYHLGQLVIFLLILLGVTGVVLLVLYRPGTERAFESVQAISRGWPGSLIRSVHRYASDALIVVAFLHALKMLLSDRFWGSRWLAWVSGWLLVVLFWLTGTMGYFLVWDGAAQWLTEYAVNTFGGAFALSFFGPEAAGRTYSFFVIILFLHAFIPLLLAIGVLVHVLRLQRPRYWAPRWLMIAATALLILFSVLWPALGNLPADLRRLAVGVQLDWWYLGFVPLITRLGNPAFWGISVAALAAVIALPWLWRGRHLGPSAVITPKCTGCAACARECPYNAIEMAPRADDSPYAQLAVAKRHLCTGCGVCVAACPEDAIMLEQLDLGALRRQAAEALAEARQAAAAPLLVYACDRHVALGSLPPLGNLTPQPSLMVIEGAHIPLPSQPTGGLRLGGGQGGRSHRIQLGAWPATAHPVVTCALPCIGALHPDAVGEALDAGAADVLFVACPAHDCGYREGARWLEERSQRRPILRQSNVRLLAAAPGSRTAVQAAAASLMSATYADLKGASEITREIASRRTPSLAMTFSSNESQGLRGRPAAVRAAAVSLALLALLFGAAIAANRPATVILPQQGQLRIVINHHGQLVASARNLPPEVLAKLPPGVDPALVLGGERFPVRLRLLVDGQPAIDRSYRPGGLRREGSIYGLETWWLPPGAHRVTINVMDDGATWQTAFDGKVDVAPGQAQVFVFDPSSRVFAQWR